MAVQVKLSASLRSRVAGYDPLEGLAVEVEEPMQVQDLLGRLGLAPRDVKIVMVNGRHADLDHPLHDGDRVALFPAVGGG